MKLEFISSNHHFDTYDFYTGEVFAGQGSSRPTLPSSLKEKG